MDSYQDDIIGPIYNMLFLVIFDQHFYLLPIILLYKNITIEILIHSFIRSEISSFVQYFRHAKDNLFESFKHLLNNLDKI